MPIEKHEGQSIVLPIYVCRKKKHIKNEGMVFPLKQK